MTTKAACRTSVFLLNYFFKCQTSDRVNGLVEYKESYLLWFSRKLLHIMAG